MPIRRVVTGVRNGKSVILADGVPANAYEYSGWPGHMTSVVWETADRAELPLSIDSEPQPTARVAPAPGETQLLIVRLPPDAVFADPRFDPARFAQEASTHLSGLFERFEPESPGMHRTDTLDYDVVLDGEIWLELDDGVETHLKQGEIVIQGGARHAWRNRSDRPATMMFVLIGARLS